jgi:DNA-binding GntR family transcriptional regulator
VFEVRSLLKSAMVRTPCDHITDAQGATLRDHLRQQAALARAASRLMAQHLASARRQLRCDPRTPDQAAAPQPGP